MTFTDREYVLISEIANFLNDLYVKYTQEISNKDID